MTLEPQVRELFEGANFAHLATTLPDGGPHTVPIWADVEDGRIVFFTQESSRKARNIARDPRVAISICDLENPYRSAWVRGRIVATREGDAALEVIDRLSHKYQGKDYPSEWMGSGEVRVTGRIHVDKVDSTGFDS